MADQAPDSTGVISAIADQDAFRFDEPADITADAGDPRERRAHRPTPVNRRQLTRLGPYALVRKLGEGGMGAVYLGRHDVTHREVAIKMLPFEALADAQAFRRFEKEVRLLAEVQHPHVTNLLGTGEHEGAQFLVMDFVEGTDLKHLLAFHGPLPERLALRVAHDVAAALNVAHERGIIHRDVKPANILVSVSARASDPTLGISPEEVCAAVKAGEIPRVKLTDFGLARHTEQSASLELTRTGAMLGTPYYIAPEQCVTDGDVGPATDVYSLGVTLFEMLAGRPPFKAADSVKLISMHCFDAPPDLRKLNPSVSDGAAQLVARMLHKSPPERQANAAHLLAEIERLLRGETNDVSMHPLLPEAGQGLVEATWEWDLAAAPADLWPWISNTDRINRAVGLPPVEYATDRDDQGAIRKLGTFRLGFVNLKWQEHPFEWVEGRRLGVLREFQNGPFRWFLSVVELSSRPDGGTRLKHSVKIATRGLAGRLLAHLEVRVKGRRGVDRVYRRIDAVISRRLAGSKTIDPFQPVQSLPRLAIRRFEARQSQLELEPIDGDCADQLVCFLRESHPAELARIRPLELARRLNLPGDRLLEACLAACQAGLLELHWDILCPTCRVSAHIGDTLAAIDGHQHCEACDLDFDVDFGNAVELIFRVHPELRQADLKTYCIGGPEHAPHVVAQTRLAAREALDLDLTLDPGRYVLRGPQLPYSVTLNVEPNSGTGCALLRLGPDLATSRAPTLRGGRQMLTLENAYARPLLLRLERTIPRVDVVTAAAASQLALFRELFPAEMLSRDQLSGVSTSTLLVIRVADLSRLFDSCGEGDAFQLIRDRLQSATEAVEAAGGRIIKQHDHQLLARFTNTVEAVRLAVSFVAPSPGTAGPQPAVRLRAALHRGTDMSTSIDGRIDYFGTTVTAAAGLLDRHAGCGLVLSADICADPDVQVSLSDIGVRTLKISRGSNLNAQPAYEVLFSEELAPCPA